MLERINCFILKLIPSKRKLIQLYSALLHNAHIKGFISGKLFDGPLKNICGPGLNCYSCPGAITACPLGSIQNALAESKTKTPTYVFGIILLYCIILGRTICGYLCPAGLLQELLYKIKTPKLKKSQVTRILSYTKYVILFILVIGVPLMYALQENNMPVPGFCKYICPIGTFEGGVFLLIPSSNSDYYGMLGALFSWKFLVMLIIVLAAIFIYRVFCRFLCPLGALYGLFNKLSIIGIKVDKEKCSDCHACINVCKMDVKEVGDHECINCGECISHCKEEAIKWKNIIADIRKERRQELALAANTEVKIVKDYSNYQMSNVSLKDSTNTKIKEEKEIKSKNDKKSKLNLYGRISSFILLIGLLITVIVLVNIDFSQKVYLQNMIADTFTTKLYSEKEYDINESDASVKVLYFYDDFNEEIFKQIADITTDNIDSIMISKYDNKEEYKLLADSQFADSNLLFGYDSVNQTEIARFSLTIEYPYIVILDKDNKVVVSEQNIYNDNYFYDYIKPLANNVVIGNEVGDLCLAQDISLIGTDEKINIRDYLGKVVVINCWYIECAPCKAELPHFSQVNSEYDEVEVIAMSNYSWYQMETEATLEFIAEQNYDLIYAYDNEGETYANALFGKTDAYPMTIIIDKEGYIRFKSPGSVTETELREAIEPLLG